MARKPDLELLERAGASRGPGRVASRWVIVTMEFLLP